MSNTILKEKFITQLTSILNDGQTLINSAEWPDRSGMDRASVHFIITRSLAAIQNIGGRNSQYLKQVEAILDRDRPRQDGAKMEMILGVVDSLKFDVQSDFLSSISEMIHGEVFSDFLDMASYLQSEGYKDPAAVIAGSALEAHLRQLCQKNEIEIIIEVEGKEIPKKADRLNTDLKKVGVYKLGDQKSVTAWLDIRNDAAHGNYDNYSKDQVTLMIQSIQNFILRNPA